MPSWPKDKPVVDLELIGLMKDLIQVCEVPLDGYDCDGPLEACHVRARGMGGGRRKDTPENLFIACRYHHRKYDGMGQSRRNQEWATQQIIRIRPVWLQEQLQEFSERD